MNKKIEIAVGVGIGEWVFVSFSTFLVLGVDHETLQYGDWNIANIELQNMGYVVHSESYGKNRKMIVWEKHN